MTTNEMDLNKIFLRVAAHHAERAFAEGRLFMSSALMHHRRKDDGRVAFEEVSMGDLQESDATRRVRILEARRVAEWLDAMRVALITEAWLLPVNPDTPELMRVRHKYDSRNAGVSNATVENSIELLSIVVESPDGTTVGDLYELVDGPTKRLGRRLTPDGYEKATMPWDLLGRTRREVQAVSAGLPG